MVSGPVRPVAAHRQPFQERLVRLPLLILAVLAGISACSNDSIRDVSAPIRRPLGDNTGANVFLTITYTGPTTAFYGSRPTFTANATLNGAPVPDVLIAF